MNGREEGWRCPQESGPGFLSPLMEVKKARALAVRTTGLALETVDTGRLMLNRKSERDE